MFALGLMLHEYLTGQRPGFAPTFSSPGEAVKAGEQLIPAPLLHPQITRLVRSLTDSRPQRRPPIEAFLEALDDESVLDFPSSVTDHRASPAGTGRPSRLIINTGPGRSKTAEPSSRLTRTSPPPAPEEDDTTSGTRPSRLRIRLDTRVPEPRPPEADTPPPPD